MEKTFQIVTDSSCDLPQAMADELDLAVLPLHVHIGEETYANYLDGREIGFHDFFNRIASGEKATTNSATANAPPRAPLTSRSSPPSWREN